MQQGVSFKQAVILLLIFSMLSFSATWFVLTSPTQKTTGMAAGVASVAVEAIVSMSIPQNSVDFGALAQGSKKNTTDDSPLPFHLRNDGNVNFDVSIRANSFLFSGTGSGNNTNKFRFMAGNLSTEPNAFSWNGSAVSFTNFSDADQIAISRLGFSNSTDEAEIEVFVNVPSNEPIGSKSADIVFTATQS